MEVEALEDVARRGRERLHVGAKVFSNVVLVAHDLPQIERRDVVEELAGFPQEEGLGIKAGRLTLFFFCEDGGLGGLKDAVQTAEDGEWEDDLAVFRLFVVAAQQVGDGPDEGGEIGAGHYLRGWEAASRGSHSGMSVS